MSCPVACRGSQALSLSLLATACTALFPFAPPPETHASPPECVNPTLEDLGTLGDSGSYGATAVATSDDRVVWAEPDGTVRWARRAKLDTVARVDWSGMAPVVELAATNTTAYLVLRDELALVTVELDGGSTATRVELGGYGEAVGTSATDVVTTPVGVAVAIQCGDFVSCVGTAEAGDGVGSAVLLDRQPDGGLEEVARIENGCAASSVARTSEFLVLGCALSSSVTWHQATNLATNYTVTDIQSVTDVSSIEGGERVVAARGASEPVLVDRVDFTPFPLGQEPPYDIRRVAVTGAVVLLLDASGDRVLAFDAVQPDSPRPLGDLAFAGAVRDLDTAGDRAFVAADDGLHAVELRCPR